MKTAVLAIVASSVSAYALSFALDMVFGAIVGEYVPNVALPVATWSAIAILTGVLALRFAPTGRYLAAPALVIAALAFLGGFRGHVFDFAVGVGMLVQAWLVWRATAPSLGRAV